MSDSKVFQSEEEFQKIYNECLDGQPQASDAIRSNYEIMGNHFEEYIAAIQESAFRYAYQCGYEAAMAKNRGGVAV